MAVCGGVAAGDEGGECELAGAEVAGTVGEVEGGTVGGHDGGMGGSAGVSEQIGLEG